MFYALALSLGIVVLKHIFLIINIHRCLHGLRGYLIHFDPHAFVPQRQYNMVSCLRIWSLQEIYTYHSYLKDTANLHYTLVNSESFQNTTVLPWILIEILT